MEKAVSTGGSRIRRLFIISTSVILVILLGWGVISLMIFRARAQGLALGYIEAAVTAYQMERYGRPLPDRIFETGPYRVETKFQGTPPVVEVNVRDRFFNITHYSLTRTVEVPGRPAPVPTGSP